MKKILFPVFLLLGTIVSAQNINMSDGSTWTCSANFYDSGGPGSNYSNNESFTYTFFPGIFGSYIEISFASYVSGAADQISIYDGPDNTYPLLFSDGGTLSIPNFTSSDFSGALTIEFNSNGAGNQAGWVAAISCCDNPIYWFADADGDGFGDMGGMPVYSCTQPVGYVDNADDCDDSAIMYEDNDGDGFGTTTPVGCGSYDDTDCDDSEITYNDNDGDTYGDPNTMVACGVSNGDDCDDNDAGVGTGTMLTWFADLDGDGYGSMWMVMQACSQPVGYVDNYMDCDDGTITYEDLDGDGFGNPSVMDPCGVYDNSDCDDNLLTYADTDGDNFGDPNMPDPCGVADNTDCDDTDAGVGGGVITTYYADNDGDGFGDPWSPFASCTPPAGYVLDDTDCDDWAILYEDLDGDGFGNPSVEVGCGSYDNSDCNDNLLTYTDNDGDNFGDPNMPDPCGVADNTDCDDTDAGVGGGTITAYHPDNDGDGFGDMWAVIYSCTPVPGCVTDASDCDDWAIMYEDLDGDDFGNPAVQVGCGSYDDSDCDDNQLTYADNDGDNFGDPNTLEPCGVADNTDCDDSDAGIGGGSMTAYYLDFDADGYGTSAFTYWSCVPVPGLVTDSTDCDDFNDNVNPGATEIAGNGIDDNCDGFADPVAGIEEPSSNSISFTMYPNPARDVVNLTWSGFSGDLVSITILNTNGQVIYTTSEAMSKNQTEIDLSSVAPGMYLVQLIGSDNTKTQLLVVE